MQKKLIALAIAGLAGSAFAQSNVTISGKMAGDVTFLRSTGVTGATDNNNQQVNNNNSNFVLSGSEKLAGGTEAYFSFGTGITMANGGAVTNNQNQIVGLKGGWGNLFVGAFDNPLKVMGRATDLFADQSTGDARHLTAVGAVEARANDVIAYITPSFGGVTGVLVHTGNPLAGVATDGTAGASTSMNIVKLAYAGGPFSAAIGYHRIDTDQMTAANVGDEKAVRVTAGYNASGLKVVGTWQKVDNSFANGSDYRVGGLGVGYTMGATTIKAQVYRLNDKTTASSDANMWAVGADYALGKRTTLQLAYSKVDNDSTATRGGAAVVGSSDAYTVVAGSDPSRLSLGIRHTF